MALSPWRQLLPALVFLSIAVIVGAVVFQQRFRTRLQEILGHESLRVARLTAAVLSASSEPPEEEVRRIAELVDARITLIDAKGVVIADSSSDAETMDNHATRPEIVDSQKRGWGQSTRRSATLGVTMIYTAVRLDDRDGQLQGHARIARGMTRMDRLSAELERTVWVAAAVVVLLGLLACYLFIEVRVFRERTKLNGGGAG